MLSGIHPLLTGTLLLHLDAMGHSDAVVIADAHFPARRLVERVIELPGADAPTATAAIRTVLPLDDVNGVELMDSGGEIRAVQHELVAASGIGADATTYTGREAFYDAAARAYVVVRTGETRPFGNVLLRKGLA